MADDTVAGTRVGFFLSSSRRHTRLQGDWSSDVCSSDLESASPLLMHNATLANPLNPLTKQFKEQTSKRKKTDENLETIMRLEYFSSLYWDQILGPYIPDVVFLASIRTAARGHQRGKDSERAVQVTEDKVPLQYKGPRTKEELYALPEFVDVRGVIVGQKRVMRCRPIFQSWKAECEVIFDEALLNKEEVTQFIKEAGTRAGIMDMRPRYGR